MFRKVTVLMAGAVFGVGLAISGMTNPQRVLGFLDVAGSWDPTLLFVMAGAVGTFAAGSFLLRRRGKGMENTELPPRSAGPINFRLLAGSAVFGIGWGIAGFCPGPALANLAALRLEAIIFVATMAIGMIIAQRVFGADRE
jgi:uncharacterized membrane protein YedE/YeeE